MGQITYREYANHIKVMDIHAQQLEEWDYQDATNIRLSVPTDFAEKKQLLENGFCFVDRMLDVSINLARSKADYAKMIRLQSELSDGYRTEIKSIAHNSFVADRRFHVDYSYNQDKANVIMDAWIDALSQIYICKCKEDVAGFLALQETDERSALIYLAAVEEKYRPAGVALSMYANAIEQCREKGVRSVKGYISSRNIPVLNLYTYLGATFDGASDVYLKER